MQQYQVIFGENPPIDEISRPQLLLYVAFSVTINIVNMNLMISIITIHLDELQMN